MLPAQNVGGVVEHRTLGGRGTESFSRVPKEKQKEAVKFLLEHAFVTPTKLLNPAIVNRFKYNGVASDVQGQQTALLRSLLGGGRMRRLGDAEVLLGDKAYSATELVNDVQDGVWAELQGEAIRIDPKYPDGYFSRGQTYFKLGQTERAIADYSAVLAQDPEHGAALRARGMAHLYLGRNDLALADLSKAIELGEKDPQLLAPVKHRSAEAQAHLMVIRARASLVRSRTALVNTARGLTKSYGERIRGCNPRNLDREKAQALRKSRDVGCYAGLQPGRRNSGQSAPQMHISKEGDPYLAHLARTGRTSHPRAIWS